MWEWVMIVVGVLGFLLTVRAVAGHVAYDIEDHPDGESWALGTMVGVVAGLVWPVVLLVWGGRRLTRRVDLNLPLVYSDNELRSRRTNGRPLGLRGLGGRIGTR